MFFVAKIEMGAKYSERVHAAPDRSENWAVESRVVDKFFGHVPNEFGVS